MSEASCQFRAYGENAATFLIFQALAMAPNAIRDVLLPNLKRFGSGRRQRSWDDTSKPEVWLFPNFGKQWGFGEPDALVLAGKHAFWFEVETTIDCIGGLPALRRALLQLWRFRLFDHALKQPVVNHRGGRRILGITLSDAREVRDASLRLAGHRVLQAIRGRLRRAESHYVLFTANQPNGEGGRGMGYARVLERERAQLVNGYPDIPRLTAEHCWYAYWNGDLERKFNSGATQLKLEDCYVRIRRR